MESEFFLPRIRDAVRLSEISSMPRFVGFLTATEAAEAERTAKAEGGLISFFGGYASAERVFFGAFPERCEDKARFWPIEAVTFSYRVQDKLSHRDVLGALMSLGIARETVGDILIEDGRAVAFLNRDILPAVMNGIDKIGRVGVTLREGFTEPLPEGSKTKELSDTVASLRLDAVVAALVGTSRGKALELIQNGLVSVNSLMVEKSVRTIKSGDRITVRGVGKFTVDSVDGMTKKGRIILKAKKFI